MEEANPPESPIAPPGAAMPPSPSWLGELAGRIPDETKGLPLSSLPAVKKAVHALRGVGVETIGQVASLSEVQVRAIMGCGPRALQDLRRRIERLVDLPPRGSRRIALRDGPTRPSPAVEPGVQPLDASPTIAALVARLPPGLLSQPIEFIAGAERRTRNLFRHLGVRTVGGLASLTDEEIRAAWGCGKGTLDTLKKAIERLLEESTLVSGIDAATAEEAPGRLVRKRPLLGLLEEIVEEFPPKLLTIWRRRVSTTEVPKTLNAVGVELGLTRERVRQLEGSVLLHVDVRGVLGKEIDRAISALRQGRATPLTLGEVERIDPWFEGASARPQFLTNLLRFLHCTHAVSSAFGNEAPVLVPAAWSEMGTLRHGLATYLHEDGSAAPTEADASAFLQSIEAPELLPILVRALAPRESGRGEGAVAK